MATPTCLPIIYSVINYAFIEQPLEYSADDTHVVLSASAQASAASGHSHDLNGSFPLYSDKSFRIYIILSLSAFVHLSRCLILSL